MQLRTLFAPLWAASLKGFERPTEFENIPIAILPVVEEGEVAADGVNAIRGKPFEFGSPFHDRRPVGLGCIWGCRRTAIAATARRANPLPAKKSSASSGCFDPVAPSP